MILTFQYYLVDPLKFTFIFMAKKSIVQREKKRKALVKKYSTLRSTLKEKIIDEKSFEKKLDLYHKIQKLPRNSSPSRLV